MSDERGYARRLAAESLAAGDPTGWFERLYQAAGAGDAVVPWADLTPNPLLRSWPNLRYPAGEADRAIVVGAGLGDDAEYLAGLGWRTTAFDVAPSAIEVAQRRFPSSTVDYLVADLLQPLADWAFSFDLVVEAYTVQVHQGAARRRAIEQIAGLVAPGGTLLVIARARTDPQDAGRMPWPLTRAEIESFPDLDLVQVEELYDDEQPPARRFRAQYGRRPARLVMDRTILPPPPAPPPPAPPAPPMPPPAPAR